MSDHSIREKPALRRWMEQLRDSLPVEAAERASGQATGNLLDLPELDVDVVHCFVSFRSEVRTRPLIEALLAKGKTVGVPQITDGLLRCRRIQSLSDLVPGRFKVPTSRGEDLGDRVGAVVTPGLAFSPEGERLGYGAGHYDRYLASLPNAAAIGFGFEHQVLGELPTDDHDHRMRAIVTDAGVHRGPPPRAVRVVGGAVIHDGRVLVARRGPGTAHAGWWELPGGKVEPGETEQQALRRELREELLIEVEPLSPLGISIHPYPGLEVALAVWTCRLADGDPTCTEHDALRWVSADELGTVAWAPADLPLVHALGVWLRRG